MARYSFYSYQMAESIDAQLKRMTDDLKEVIDHLNTGTGAGDKNKEPVSFIEDSLQSCIAIIMVYVLATGIAGFQFNMKWTGVLILIKS